MPQDIRVTQADREAAAYVHAAEYGSATPGYQWTLSGEQDDDSIVQAFARHRVNALEECAKIADQFANTRPESGPYAAALAAGMSEAGKQCAILIRNLKDPIHAR